MLDLSLAVICLQVTSFLIAFSLWVAMLVTGGCLMHTDFLHVGNSCTRWSVHCVVTHAVACLLSKFRLSFNVSFYMLLVFGLQSIVPTDRLLFRSPIWRSADRSVLCILPL